MKPYVRGKSVFFREVTVDDAEFIIDLRTDQIKSRYLSTTSDDVAMQRQFIKKYLESATDFYFIVCDWSGNRVGTIRIYDIREDSFSWGSWIKSNNAPKNFAIESALLIYEFGFFSLHYSKVHFDVRKENERVVNFHKRFGASIVSEDELNYYFNYDIEAYMAVRPKYKHYLPGE